MDTTQAIQVIHEIAIGSPRAGSFGVLVELGKFSIVVIEFKFISDCKYLYSNETCVFGLCSVL